MGQSEIRPFLFRSLYKHKLMGWIYALLLLFHRLDHVVLASFKLNTHVILSLNTHNTHNTSLKAGNLIPLFPPSLSLLSL